ncbi:BatD family protein [Candidatus Omnitrophota bacterium]
MPRYIRKIIVITIFVVVFFSMYGEHFCCAQKDNVQVTAAFNKRSALVGEEIHLSIKIQGEFGSVPRPRLPQFDGFQWYYMQQSSRVEYSSFSKKYNKIVEFIFVFVPQRPGEFTIGPFDITVERKVYQHPAINITVEGQVHPSALTKMQSQAPQSTSTSSQTSHPFHSSTAQGQGAYVPKGADRNIFLKVWTDKKEVYPGEQVTLTYSLFTQLDTRYEGFKDEPNTKGFWMEDISMKKGVVQKTVNVNGERYLQADIRKIALFGTHPGEYVIKPGSIKCSIKKQDQEVHSDYFGSFFEDQFFGSQMFARREERALGAEDMTIIVKPFPEKNKPEEFDNMVGSFVISATVDKKKVAVNEPIKVDVTVQGKGNIDTIVPPLSPPTDQFRVIEGETETKKVSGDVIIGWKRFSYLFVPKKMGDFSIGPFRTVFFDPFNEKYISEQSEAFKITVIKGDYEEEDLSAYLSTPVQDIKKEVKRIDSGIYFIKESLLTKNKRNVLQRSVAWLKIIDAMMLVLFLIIASIKMYRTGLDKNVGLKRHRQAYRIYMKNISRLSKRAHSKKTAVLVEIYSEIARITMNYFSDKFNLANYSLTYQQIDEKLDELHIEKAFRDDVRALFDTCDFARFAPSSISQSACKEALDKSKDIVMRFEKMKVANNE